MQGEIYTFTLEDEKDPSMNSNKYQFSHTYGKVRIAGGKYVNRF